MDNKYHSMFICFNHKKYHFRLCLIACFVGGWGILSAQSLQEQARIQYYNSMLHEEQFTYQEKVGFYDSILNIYNEDDSHTMWIDYASQKMKLYNRNGAYLEAYKTGLEILDKFDDKPELSDVEALQKISTQLFIAKCCINLGMYDESISLLYSIIQVPEHRYTAEAYSYLGFVFMLMQQMEKSRTYHEKALEILAGSDDSVVAGSSFSIYNNLGGYYYSTFQPDSAIYYLNLSVDYYDRSGEMRSRAFVYHNMAIIYQQMGENSMAVNYLQKALELALEEPYTYALCAQNLAFLLFQEGKPAEAEQYYLKALRAADESGAKQVKSLVLIELSDLKYKSGEFEKAWLYLKSGMNLRDSVFSDQNMERIALLTQQFDNYKITTEKELLEKNLQLATLTNEKKNIVLTVMFSLFVVITIAAIIIVRRIKKKSADYIKQETKETEKEVRKELATTLEEKNRKLASNALYLLRTRDVFDSLDQNVRLLLSTEDLEKHKEIAKEMASIMSGYTPGREWEEFKFYFEQVHSSFYINLNKLNPGLSSMEQRLCALLALNMNAKEIAQMTNRSVRSIETFIYRLRKSLNMPPEEKTAHFLRKLLGDYEESFSEK